MYKFYFVYLPVLDILNIHLVTVHSMNIIVNSVLHLFQISSFEITSLSHFKHPHTSYNLFLLFPLIQSIMFSLDSNITSFYSISFCLFVGLGSITRQTTNVWRSENKVGTFKNIDSVKNTDCSKQHKSFRLFLGVACPYCIKCGWTLHFIYLTLCTNF